MREPGIYSDIPFTEYLAWDAVSNSAMNALAVSPLHYKFGDPIKETAPMRLGSLTHCGALEATHLAKRYAVLPEFHLDAANKTDAGKPSTSVATKYVKEKLAAFRAANADKEIVSEAEYTAMVRMCESLARCDAARELLTHPGPAELSLLWDDPDTGIRCKARIDKLAGQDLVDLKTTAAITKFANSLAGYSYHRQLAHYQAGYAVLTGELLTPWIVAMESAAPYAVLAAPVADEAIEQGERDRRKLLTLLAECMESDTWPGPPTPDEWNLPALAVVDEPLTLTIGGQAVEV